MSCAVEFKTHRLPQPSSITVANFDFFKRKFYYEYKLAELNYS